MQDNIFPIWQPQGFSTHIIAKNLSKKLGVLTSHTGTLDPMARGVIVVLAEETRLKKYEFAEWLKTYEFDLVFGIETDTFDGLGLIKNTNFNFSVPENLQNILNTFKGDYVQDVPSYSAIKVLGKPMHFYARNNLLETITIPKRKGEIKEIKLLQLQKIPLKDLINELEAKIKNITGDLRQDEILNNWEKLMKEFSNEFLFTAKIEVTTTKGIYIRGLGADIFKKLNMLGFVNNITRTKNGEFTKENAFSLESLFGLNFVDNYDFVSRG